jgi:Fic family protein
MSDESDQDIIQRLDRLIAIQQIVHKDALASARTSIREDSVSAAILDATSDWVAAGKLKASVMQKAKQSKPTVERRIAALVDLGALDKRGSGGSVSYRTNGLI